MDFINCPWCTQRTPDHILECRKCGGPLPPPIGSDPGPAPPFPPRQLPAGYRRRKLMGNNVPALVGLIFTLVGFPLGVMFTILGIALPGMWLFIVIGGGIGGIFTLVGGALAYFGIRQGLSTIRPFVHGQPAIGEVIEIFRDRSVSINGRNPWGIIYTFKVHGRHYEGKVLSWKHAPQTQAVGNRVYVLYMPDDPDQNVIYPPVT
jgi:hypothetical protein